jgi:AcrR family transcriptional regulator
MSSEGLNMTSIEKSTKQRRKVKQGEIGKRQILEAVDDLFYQEGARAVGVDAVAKRAGVHKMTLYRQFDSKDALLLEYLARMEQIFWGHFEASADKHPNDPRAQILQFFIDLEIRSRSNTFRGCPFVNIAAEFADSSHPARKAVAKNKKELLRRLWIMAKAAGAKNPRRLANGLAFLIEGAYAASQTFAPEERVLTALPPVAKMLLEAETL